MKKLPTSAQEIAEVIGRDRALFLIGQLPCCFVEHKGSRGAAKSKRVIMYVPKSLKPDHRLVAILGWKDASKLVDVFGGEIICPPTLENDVYRPFRDTAIKQLLDDGVGTALVADWFGMTARRVRQLAEIPQEVKTSSIAKNSRKFLDIGNSAP